MASYSEFLTPALRGGKQVRSVHGHTTLVTEATYPEDTGITVWIAGAGDGPRVFLSPRLIDEIVADWAARRALLNGGSGA